MKAKLMEAMYNEFKDYVKKDAYLETAHEVSRLAGTIAMVKQQMS